MKWIFALLAFTPATRADFSEDKVPATPKILERLIAGAEQHGQPLRSMTTKGESTVYYLQSAEYLGECAAPFGSVHIARLGFLRSGVRGQSSAPPRGHAFLVFYDADFRVRGYWRNTEEERFSIQGTKLFHGTKEIFDYGRIPERSGETNSGTYPHPPVWKSK